MRFYWLVLAILAVWRVAHLLNAEDGPWELLAKLRFLAGYGLWGKLLDCFYCLSLWIAAPVAYFLGERWGERLLLWLAISGGACLIERPPLRKGEFPQAVYTEDEEPRDVLRKKPDPVSENCFQAPAP